MPGTTVGEALSDAKRSIERRDAEYLLSHLLGTSRASIIAHSDRQIDPAAAARFHQWVAARADGKPVAQILGVREFYGRDFAIDEHVLIPRPETLVEQALARISKQKSLKTPANRRLSILDLGTGSGIVAITVKLEAPDCEVVAVDASAAALRNARANAATLNAPVRFLDSNWYGALDGQCFDVIVSNPPYVAMDDPHLSRGDLRFEPMMALTDQSPDGLASIRAITAGASVHLRPNGWLMLEHGYNQAETVRQLMGEARLTAVQSTRDLAGIERVTSGQRPA